MVLINWLVEAEAAKRDPDGSKGVISPREKKRKRTTIVFFSPGGRTPPLPSGSRLAASASSNQALNTGFRAIMLIWLRDSNLK